MSDQEKRLRAMLDDLESGRLSIADACAQVRGMNWPRATGKTAFQTRLSDAIGGLMDLPPDDSFIQVSHEYHAGRIDYRQYEALDGAYEETLGDQPGRDTGGAEPRGS